MVASVLWSREPSVKHNRQGQTEAYGNKRIRRRGGDDNAAKGNNVESEHYPPVHITGNEKRVRYRGESRTVTEQRDCDGGQKVGGKWSVSAIETSRQQRGG
jgi:hypothetical protein